MYKQYKDFETIKPVRGRKHFKERKACAKCGKMFEVKHGLRMYCNKCKGVKQDDKKTERDSDRFRRY